jgi:acetyl esterase/lipase
VSNKDHQGKPMMLHFASRGWVCFSANYALAPRSTWPEHIIDLKRAIAWIRAHGEEYGADPRFIVVAGGSAGGHLASLLALSPDEKEWQPGFEDADTSVQACIPHYGIYDFVNEAGIWLSEMRTRFLVERLVMRARRSTAREAFLKASPFHRIHAEPPPFFVIHGSRDLLVPVKEARLFVEKLRSVSTKPVVYAELPGAQHAFDVFPSVRTSHVIRASERFADWCYSDWVRSSAPTESRAT